MKQCKYPKNFFQPSDETDNPIESVEPLNSIPSEEDKSETDDEDDDALERGLFDDVASGISSLFNLGTAASSHSSDTTNSGSLDF